jgi:hypothetical protein
MKINFYNNLDLASKGVWFPIIIGILILFFLILMPKRLSRKEIYLTFGTVGYVALLLDIFILGTVFDLFDLGRPTIEGIGDTLSYAIIAPSLAVIFLNFYKQEKRWLYTIIFTVVSFLYEIILVKVGYMTLHGWNSLFSLPIEFIFYGFWFPWHLKLIRKKSI